MNSRFQRITLIGVLLLLLILGGGYYLIRSIRPKAGSDSTTAGQAQPASSIPAQGDTRTKLPEDALTAARKYWRLDPANLHWDNISKAEIDRDLSSKYPHVRARALGDLLNTRYKREEVIAMLRNYLDHPHVEIRFQAARLLFILGSDTGRDVMVSLLQAGAREGSPSEQLVFGAAQILYQYRQPFDSRLLYKAYQQSKSTAIKWLGILAQLPEIRQEIAADLKTNFIAGYAQSAGLLRLNDPVSVASLQSMLSLDPDRALTASWALYQGTGDSQRLAYVIEIAQEYVGMKPRTEKLGDRAGLQSIKLLSITSSPEAINALKEISEHAARSGDSMVFDIAFASLYYVQKDYAYVDQKVVELMSGPKDKPSFSTVWKIAAERGTPQLELLAIERNPGAYKQHFILEQGRPVESWIYQYLSNIPAEALPPIRP